ncbi:MAG: bifunctional (p)ppGpp synthetase/guanosine-3',5'-bis(diphosphate) 3'-pyrophosphohydrolase [Myxococcales bacterium]|nr:bifunctional (p)ppGpp synthetase/guanosine-3',5'-bis(diphosphate) 3'-pyrophosphohydrolase [Myxococcales bacterium]
MLTAQELASKVSAYQPLADVEFVHRAYAFAERAHTGQLRKSGDPYFVHPVSVAAIVTELRLDVASVCAALLHDVLEDCSVSERDLEAEFGPEVTFLVDGVTKLNQIDFRSKQDRVAESFRKMVGAMSRDIRVLVVKLCDRLDNMRTLEHMSLDGQERIARETMDIYAPLANRLGLSNFRNELQDLSFRYLQPEGFATVSHAVEKDEPRRQAASAKVCRLLTNKLSEQGFPAQVSGRQKGLYSIWRKMQDRQCGYEQIYDHSAFRVVVESVADCYATLGVVHSMWTPVPGRFKDYIALPKPNMYQALHTTVFGPDRQRIEVQTRTREMHQVAEYGIAAHWRFREKIGGGIDAKDAAPFAWLRQLMDSQSEFTDPAEFLESLKGDLFQDEVFVFTPKGDLRTFVRGSTPIDFAFGIHTNLGTRCSGARVNGSVVPLGYKLRNGDLVEIVTSNEQQPVKEWLDWAVTSRARGRIRTHLRQLQRERSIKLGRELLERELHAAGISFARLEKNARELAELCAHFGVKGGDELFVGVGYGRIKPQQIVEALSPKQHEGGPTPPPSIREGRIEAFVRKVTGKSSQGILLNGTDDMLVRYTKCCNPLPGDDIVGFLTRGRGITVHRRNCEKAFTSDPGRRVEVKWDAKAKINRPVRLTVTTANRPGILATVGSTFHAEGINISEATCRASDDGRATNTFTFLCGDVTQLKGVMRRLQKIDGVVEVERA